MTKEDLEQIGKLIEPLKQGQERLEKRMDGLEQGQARFEKKMEDLDMKIEVSFAATNTKLDKRSEQIIDFITDTATEILKEQDQRISHIEGHLGLENPKKN